jgi:hypothetical protein
LEMKTVFMDTFDLFRGKYYPLNEEECAHHDDIVNWLLDGNTPADDRTRLVHYFELPPMGKEHNGPEDALAIILTLCDACRGNPKLYHLMVQVIDMVREGVL